MEDPPGRDEAAQRPRDGAAPVSDLAAEAERGRTTRTPVVALAGVWLAVAIVVAVVLAIALTAYFVYG